ncbi:molybdopterin-dependent oxidoreductase [Cereibacter sphaeroides]|uniref:molybdopterin-dependent oxidoreductase n=1 Tax=Cereibacter sphaeroides TaxID=1063 RepID=UPI001F332F9F|nr:molybdopterin-dependent oxidoreductase [Cereibacter sphaeroides]MCE6961885.1 molybdopterin-dependent oxidoreductase [Cereibacter sphaeroides]MCE6975744.1 molybdopterin-dependent oxidoreductase [Cereibacter sphaeroides]
MSGIAKGFVTVGRGVGAAAGLVVALALPALAQDLSPPSGQPVLTVDGPIQVTNVAGKAVFDMRMLQDMPKMSYRTSTVWTDGVLEFTGVPLKALLDRLGAAEGVSVSAKAINDYAVEIPADAITDEAPIIAYHIEGEEFSRREKGPLWVLFPYDADEKYRTEVTYGRSIWQLDRLTVSQ